ncbi:MAG: S-methyl-5-thioribose-1-phosphate isomerase [Acidobacteria bacterium]|nr:S-methyl-5-thioribose-1-phosphate isomerase [Acidobacteriota bacterium]MDW7985344.1 S-methyl-5-thioribose-1-phosphate isomerase [Acidobacteriota bacterium]
MWPYETPIVWQAEDHTVWMIDQRYLPHREDIYVARSYEDVAWAIRTMVIRGAPAIGVAAAMGVALAFRDASTVPVDPAARQAYFRRVAETLRQTRPTAVNLTWALGRMERVLEAHLDAPPDELFRYLRTEALEIQVEDVVLNQRIGEYGAQLFQEPAYLLTICNTGFLATAGYGTAAGVIRTLWRRGLLERVYVCETRPYLQGARLTMWEFLREGIPATLITDGMAGFLVQRGMVSAVLTGADRIARNGDTANKVGTYTLAVLAHYHGLPFYVAAPYSTIDMATPDGIHIPIEERDSREVTHVMEVPIAPEGTPVWNPAFDVTPHELITAIITDQGVIGRPIPEELARRFSTPANVAPAARLE